MKLWCKNFIKLWKKEWTFKVSACTLQLTNNSGMFYIPTASRFTHKRKCCRPRASVADPWVWMSFQQRKTCAVSQERRDWAEENADRFKPPQHLNYTNEYGWEKAYKRGRRCGLINRSIKCVHRNEQKSDKGGNMVFQRSISDSGMNSQRSRQHFNMESKHALFLSLSLF